MLGPFATASRRTPIHQVSLPVLSHAACASISTTTTTTRDRADRYGPIEWAQSINLIGFAQIRRWASGEGHSVATDITAGTERIQASSVYG